MKILFMTNVPSPYRVDFFNELGKLCDLTVLFEKHTSDERDKSWSNYNIVNFNAVFLKGKSTGTDNAFCPECIKYLSDKSFDKIICADFTTPTGIAAISYMKLKKIPYWLECDGGFAKSGAGFKEKLKSFLIKGAYGYLSTSAECDNYYITYGADKNKIYRYPFTALKEADVISYPLSAEKKTKYRKKLGMTEKKIVVSVGQFIYRKGYDLLINAAADTSSDIGYYIVGGKAGQEYVELVKKHRLTNVHFVDFKLKDELKEYYYTADVFVLPTREDIWGLVVNEALACGVPVITTNKCIAGLELIKNGVNGYIVKSDDIKALSDGINNLFGDDKAIENMSRCALDTARSYTIEKMAKAHIDILGGRLQ